MIEESVDTSMQGITDYFFNRTITEYDARHALHHEKGWDILPMVVRKTTIKRLKNSKPEVGLAYGFFAQWYRHDENTGETDVQFFDILNNSNNQNKTLMDARLAQQFLHESYNQKITRQEVKVTVNAAQSERNRIVYEKEWLDQSKWRKCFCLPVLDESQLIDPKRYLETGQGYGRRRCYSRWEEFFDNR